MSCFVVGGGGGWFGWLRLRVFGSLILDLGPLNLGYLSLI